MLFKEELKKDNSPVDNTSIRQVPLFFDEIVSLEFKELCKKGMMQMWPDTFREANISDFLLELLRKHYGNTNRG